MRDLSFLNIFAVFTVFLFWSILESEFHEGTTSFYFILKDALE